MNIIYEQRLGEETAHRRPYLLSLYRRIRVRTEL